MKALKTVVLVLILASCQRSEDRTGEIWHIPKSYEIAYPVMGKITIAYTDANKWSAFNAHRKQVVVPFRYDYMTEFSGALEYDGTTCHFSGALAGIKRGEQWGFIDITGKVVVPFQYEGAVAFGDGLAGVKKNGKWGFINPSGEVVIPFRYEDTGIFSNDREGVVIVSLKGKWGAIDKAGKTMIAFEHERSELESDY